MRRSLYAGLIIALLSAAFVAALPTGAQTQTGFPTPTPMPDFSTCQTPLAAAPGDTAGLRAGVSLRSAPSPSAPWLAAYEDNSSWTILDGPVCEGGINWWRVTSLRLNDAWVSEGPATGGFWFNTSPEVRARATDPDHECSDAQPFEVGEPIRLLTGVKLRSAPNLGGAVLTVAPIDGVAEILGEPICADEINWWPVLTFSVGNFFNGWMAEGQFGVIWLRSGKVLPVCTSPLPFSTGDRGFVNNDSGTQPRNLRTLPGLDAPIATQLLEGVGFEVIGGPICVDDLNWWQISVLTRPDVSGWISEGGGPDFSIEKIRSEVHLR